MPPSAWRSCLLILKYFVNRGTGNAELPGDIRCASSFAVECQHTVSVDGASAAKKRMPFSFASCLPSFVRSSILRRSAWATADRMVTTIWPISPSVLIPSSINRTATPWASNSFISWIISAVSRPRRSSFFTRMASPSSTFMRSRSSPGRSTELPDALSVKIRFAFTPASLSARI